MPVAVSGSRQHKDGGWNGEYPVVIRFYPVVSVCKRLKKAEQMLPDSEKPSVHFHMVSTVPLLAGKGWQKNTAA